MPKPTYSREEIQREGALVRQAIDRSDAKISQEDCMSELGIAQSNLSQWLNGQSRISDFNLVWLGDKYNFDVVKIRPSLQTYERYFAKWTLLRNLSPDNQRKVLGLIEALEGADIGIRSRTRNLSEDAPDNVSQIQQSKLKD